MIGEGLTAADISAYFQIQSLIVVDFDFSGWKKISTWMELLAKNEHIMATNFNFMRLLPKIKPKKAKL